MENKTIENVAVTTVADKNKGGENVMMTKSYMKEEGFLMTTADVLGALAKAPGFKAKDSKNFAAVMNGLKEGYSVVEMVNNPSLIDVNKNQYRYFKDFVSTHKLANRVYAPTRKGVLVPFFDVEQMKIKDGKVYSEIDYSEVNEFSYKEVSESYLSEMFASQEKEIVFSNGGEVYKTRKMLPMMNVFFGDLNLDLPEDESNYDEEHELAVKLRDKVLEEGFYYIDADGEERHAYFFMQSASQARTLEAMFINTGFMSPVDALKLLGNELIAYAKQDEDGNYSMDVTKMLSRPGLSGTNSINIESIRVGSDIIYDGDDMILTGGNVEMRITEDRYSNVTEGKYRMWNAEAQKFEEFDAKDQPLKLMVADGAVFISERVAGLIEAATGVFTDAVQFRITPFTKGLAIVIPNLDAYYDEDIIALESAVKGNYEHLFAMNPEYEIQFRVAILNKDIRQVKQFTNMPYQFVQASSMNVSDVWNTTKQHLENVSTALYDAEEMKKYVGLDKVIREDLIADEVAHYELDKSRVSTFTTFLDMFPWAYQDPQMKKYAADILKESIEDWKMGNVPVEGHYRYMIQDPYAVLEAGTKYEERDASGDLMVVNRGDYHIQPMRGVVPSAVKGKSNTHIAIARNPMISKGEWQVLENSSIDIYNRAKRKGFFTNLLVMSAHDMATFAMGGADNDGDTALTVTEDSIISAVMRNQASPVMDISFKNTEDGVEVIGDGCPYGMELAGVYKLPEGLVEKQDNYHITFTEKQNTRNLYRYAHRLGVDYVLRTLKPNKIGLATNIATILADAVRGLGYKVASGKSSNPEADLATIKDYENKIDMLRLVQGWEIDAAKHGGAYQEVMKDTLDFMDNPPVELSKMVESGKRVWIKPDWLAARANQKGVNRGSVLSQSKQLIESFEANYLDKAVADALENHNNTSILATLNSAFNLEPEYFMTLVREVTAVKSGYGNAVRNVILDLDAKKREYIMQGYPADAIEFFMENENEVANKKISVVADNARDEILELMSIYPAKDIGYVAYYITYVDRKEGASLAFPWAIAREAFIQTLLYVEGKEKQDQIKTREVLDTNFSLAVCIPDAVQEKFGLDVVLAGLAKEKVFVHAVGNSYKLYINKTEVGFAYTSHNNIKELLGHDKFYIIPNAIAKGSGARTVNLEVDKLIKL